MASNLGCFSERSINIDPENSVRLRDVGSRSDNGLSTRAWLRAAHTRLADLLPESSEPPLLTEDMVTADGQAVDVFGHFGNERAKLQSIVSNYRGIVLSAQAASRDYYIEKTSPEWPGFEDVWLYMQMPIPGVCFLNARVGWARDEQGNIVDADAVVILPGLFGDHGVKRSADLAIPLRKAGYHVVHLEPRGHGQTEARCPDMSHTFGFLETDDLVRVSDWLETMPHVRRTGLVGYCWTANIALLAAWYDGRPPDDGVYSEALGQYLLAYDQTRERYRAGVIAFSPVLRWEVLMDELDRQRSRWGSPIYAAIQDTVRDRMERKGCPDPDGNLRRLVDHEFRGYDVELPNGVLDGYPFMRLLPYKGETHGDKLERARIPVLIVHGADDPLVPAQDVADLIAITENPNVGAVILPSGGHVGFGGYAPNYYFSLITNFFNQNTGPTAQKHIADPQG